MEDSVPDKAYAKFDLRAFSLGLSRGLIVCPPLFLLLVTYSAAFTTPLDSFVLALLFGIGTALSPILLLGGVTGWLLTKAPLFKKWIAILGGALLIVLGLSTLISTIAVK
jgi:putative Mn2+ efflux pump MntP